MQHITNKELEAAVGRVQEEVGGALGLIWLFSVLSKRGGGDG